jgi:GNAT superfamily N-acetyltransferase
VRSWLDGRERRLRLARDGGWTGALSREVEKRVLNPVCWTTRDLVVYEFAALAPRIEPPDGIRIEMHAPGAEPPLDALLAPALRPRARRRLAAGRILHVARRGEQAVGMTWTSTEVTPALEREELTLPPGWVYGDGLYVHRSLRRDGVGAALMSAASHDARDAGWTHSCGVVYGANVAALGCHRAVAGVGMRVHPLGRVRVLWGSRR